MDHDRPGRPAGTAASYCGAQFLQVHTTQIEEDFTVRMLKLLAALVVIAVAVGTARPIDAAPPVKITAFSHTVVTTGTGANICQLPAGGTDASLTVLNNPATNGNPNAVIVVTYDQTGPAGGIQAIAGPLTVF